MRKKPNDEREDTQASDNTDAFAILDRIRRRRLRSAIAAVVISLVLHTILAFFFPQLSLFRIERISDKKPPKIRLRDVAKIEPSPRVTPQDRTASPTDRKTTPNRDALSFRHPIDEILLQPTPLPDTAILADNRSLVRPESKPQPHVLDPRQEILKIDKAVIADDVAALPRRYQPDVPRIKRAADVLPPADRAPIGYSYSIRASTDNLTGELGFLGDSVTSGQTDPQIQPPAKLPPVTTQSPALVPHPDEPKINLRAIEKLLQIKVATYASPTDPRYDYCRISIERISDAVLPVLPKDFLLVQDCSASMTEQKLYFCRQGLLKTLAHIAPEDRFNVLGFRDTIQLCFPTWTNKTEATLRVAEAFIRGLKAQGDTDFFASMRFALELPRDPARPVISLLVSDGAPTKGITDSTEIIEEFSRANAGSTSVIGLSTFPGANTYLMDLMSYRNRGDTAIVKSGRWDIPAAVESRSFEVSRPVLSSLHFIFSTESQCQAYPLLTSNLYLDRPLVIYGRYPRGTRNLVMQAVGKAGAVDCDMVFNVDLTQETPQDPAVRTEWAWQRIYHLIGIHTRTRSPETLDEIRRTAKVYGLKVPYERQLRL